MYDYTAKSYHHWVGQPTVEDDMRAEIRRLEEENRTLRATLVMVRRVLATTINNTDDAVLDRA